MPNAHHVYIGNHSDVTDAISLGTGSSFEMNTTGNLTAGTCSNGQSSSKAVLFVRSGDFKEPGNGTLLRLCRTTAFMMGGRSDGCVPLTAGTAPTTTPCAGINSGLGNGQFTQQGGDIDWTPPDTIDATLDPVTQRRCRPPPRPGRIRTVPRTSPCGARASPTRAPPTT